MSDTQSQDKNIELQPKIKSCAPFSTSLLGSISESLFDAQALKIGLAVYKPLVDDASIDRLVFSPSAKRYISIQVRSAHTRSKNDRANSFVMVANKYGKKKCLADFFAFHLFACDDWYIIPSSVVGDLTSIRLTYNSAYQSRFDEFKNAWHLLLAG